mgnify:CR=1 FL=1
MELKEKLVSSFIAFENQISLDNPFVHCMRTEALSRFESQGFPEKKDEAWKYTSLKSVIKEDFTIFSKKKNVLDFKNVKNYFLLILFSGFTFSEQISFNCKSEKHLMYYYEDNGDFKRTYDSVLSRDRTYSFDTDKKILRDNYGGEGPYSETELFLEWMEIYNGDEDNYSKYKFNLYA